jgi:hypothetical protein
VSRVRAALLLYGVLNATAYSCLLPLWEGFDEAYHYGYVQFLSTNPRFPVLGQAYLSREIWRSLELAPVSHYLQPFTGAPVSFSEYFALPAAERERRRKELDAIPAQEKYLPQTDKPNYEVNQSPLPYVAMAAVDRLLLNASITTRVLTLRLLGSIAAVLLTAAGVLLIARRLALPGSFANAALFIAFSSQMLYATVCHVCNDWLAVPALAWCIWAAIRAVQSASARDALLLGVILAAALLTKAYFLVFVPLAFVAIFWTSRRNTIYFMAALLAAAGPWYIRNLALYRNLSATVESTSGLGPRRMLDAALALPWRESIAYMAHSSLWTGNNSFTTFSSATLNLMLLSIAAGALLYVVHAKFAAPEMILLTAILVFIAELAAISVAFFASSNGRATAAVPWYMQVLLAPVLLVVFLGVYRAGRWGRALLPLTAALWGYVLAATYVAKLVPLYGGFTQPKASIPALWNWYQSSAVVAPAQWAAIAAVLLLDIVLCVLVIRDGLHEPIASRA